MQTKIGSTLTTKVITGALVLALLIPVQRGMAAPVAPVTPTTTTTEPGKDNLWVCAAVGIIIGIGVAGVYIIIRLCQIHPPPPPPAVPPPPPPVVPTNAPPIVTNTPPIIVARLQATPLDGPPMPGGTNQGPYNTNLVNMTHAPYYWLPGQWATNMAGVTNTLDNGQYYDVSSYGWYETNSGVASLVKAYGTGPIASLSSSTNLVNWSNYTYQVWVSGNGAISVLSDGQGQPVMTNYGAGLPSSSGGVTNSLTLGIWVGNESSKFHRLLTP